MEWSGAVNAQSGNGAGGGVPYLPLVNFVSIVVLGIAFVILWSSWYETRHGTPTATTERHVRLIPKDSTPPSLSEGNVHSFPFNLVMAQDGERMLRVPSSGWLHPLRFGCLSHYDVCCFAPDDFFVCRSATRNVGVEAVLHRHHDGGGGVYASVTVQHPDMLGARCVLRWTHDAANCTRLKGGAQ